MHEGLVCTVIEPAAELIGELYRHIESVKGQSSTESSVYRGKGASAIRLTGVFPCTTRQKKRNASYDTFRFQNSYKYVSRSTGIAFRPESGYCPVPWT